ncbi:MAG: hypothetical protein MJK18_13540, partial [Bdellovibrionales bacterium]|nr:hypothetical protein [Bdellovibrionales bacterium]
MLRKTMFFSMLITGILTLSHVAMASLSGFDASFLDPDDIKNPYQVYSERDSNVTKAQFDAVIDKAQKFYEPIVRDQGGRLSISGDWSDDTVNATASQFFGFWRVNMYGGLARHPDMTLDGFSLVICHEMGHHLGGFPFYKRNVGFGGVWAANEGQSDYYTTFVCARALWADEVATNAEYRDTVPAFVQDACASAWETTEEQDLCYRINAGSQSLANTLATLADDVVPQFDTPDTNKVEEIQDSHPAAQCRLDTYFAGSICKADFDINFIPGKDLNDPFGKDAELES